MRKKSWLTFVSVAGMAIALPACTAALVKIQSQQAELLQTQPIIHPVSFNHAASKTGLAEKNKLYQLIIFDPNDSSQLEQASYYMDVKSVFCGEDICKIDTVRLFWDGLGQYTKFELKAGVDLEKNADVYFDKQDYQKLHKILGKKDNGLKNLHKDELIRPKAEANAVDALSGATIAIRTQDYVEGAIWTCFTLWHFANGEVVQQIRNFTAKHFNGQQLVQLLSNDTSAAQEFAIEQLTAKQSFDQADAFQVLNNLNRLNDVAIQLIPEYLATANAKEQPKIFIQAFVLANPKLKKHLLEYLNRSVSSMPVEFYAALSQQLFDWSDYADIAHFISLVERHHIQSEIINKNLLALLKHNNLLIARRSYWYLYQQAGLAEHAEMKDFYRKTQHKL